MFDIFESVYLFFLFCGELILIFGAMALAWKWYSRYQAKKNLDVQITALSATEESDPELFKMGQNYSKLLAGKIWFYISTPLRKLIDHRLDNHMSDLESKMDQKFAAYNTDLDLRLKPYENIENNIAARLDNFLIKYNEALEKEFQQKASSLGGEIRADNINDAKNAELVNAMKKKAIEASEPVYKILDEVAADKELPARVRRQAKTGKAIFGIVENVIAKQQSKQNY